MTKKQIKAIEESENAKWFNEEQLEEQKRMCKLNNIPLNEWSWTYYFSKDNGNSYTGFSINIMKDCFKKYKSLRQFKVAEDTYLLSFSRWKNNEIKTPARLKRIAKILEDKDE